MDFGVSDDFAGELDWVGRFMAEEVRPVDQLVTDPLDVHNPLRQALIRPLQAKVKERGLWAAHLGRSLGGQGFGQVRLALMNEILGQSRCAPVVFGCQAPDSGNAEILAAYGTTEHKERFLRPLLDGEVMSCFSMTEPAGGSDPSQFTTKAESDGDGGWVLNGEKWFSSGADRAAFLIVMAVTDPDAPPHSRLSAFIVPRETPGIEVLRNVAVYGRLGERMHAHLRYNDVRIPGKNLLGERGGGFAVAQTRLGGGRIHHAMRTVGAVRDAFDMMCERALSRTTKGERLADKQLVQEMIAESWVEIEQFRLLVLRTAWKIDELHDYRKVRHDIAAVKIALPKVMTSVASRAVQIHGALGVSEDMPLAAMVVQSLVLGIADGPTEVHKGVLARAVLKEHQPVDSVFPSRHLPTLRRDAEERYADVLAATVEDIDG